MDSSWLWAAIAIAAAIVVGSIASRIVRNLVSGPRLPDGLKESAPAIASMAFSLCLVAGLMVALGFVRPEALDQIINDTVSYLPKMISAGIVLILGDVAGTLAGSAAAQTVGRSAGNAAAKVPAIVKGIIMAFAVILASSQLGVDTTVVNIAVAAILFSIGLSAAMLIGFGGRSVSSEIAAGRALKRILSPGDEVRTDELMGRVLTVHSTAIELEVEGESLLIPNSEIMDSTLTINRSSAAAAAPSSGAADSAPAADTT